MSPIKHSLRTVHILWWTSNPVRPKFSNEYYKVGYYLGDEKRWAVYFTMESALGSDDENDQERARGDRDGVRDPV